MTASLILFEAPRRAVYLDLVGTMSRRDRGEALRVLGTLAGARPTRIRGAARGHRRYGVSSDLTADELATRFLHVVEGIDVQLRGAPPRPDSSMTRIEIALERTAPISS